MAPTSLSALSKNTDNYFAERRAFYGNNALPPPRSKTFIKFCWEAFQDKTLLFLIGAAAVEIAVGIYKQVMSNETAGIYDGVAIIAAVLIVVVVSAGNDYRKQGQFRSLNDYSRGLAQTKVIRDAQTVQVDNSDIMVGDVVLIDTGDVIPADGVFISGFNLKCDESSLTGETDASVKGAGHLDPFLISGTKVINGVGKMLVIGTGVNSQNGRIMINLNVEQEDTPLQEKLTELADTIAKYGVASALIMVVILIVAYFTAAPLRDKVRVAEDMINIIISAVTVIVVAVPEGLPLAVTLALAHATLRMLKDNNLVRHLSACETMGNATTICSDKTGTLTQNKMTVVRARVFSMDVTLSDIPEKFKENALKSSPHKEALLALLCNNINVNSSASETESSKDQKLQFIGSKTEVALLEMTRKLGYDYAESRSRAVVGELFPFSSESKKMATVIKGTTKTVAGAFPEFEMEYGEYVLYTKGASEIILEDCTKFVDNDGKIQLISEKIRSEYLSTIGSFARDALRTLCVAFKPLPSDYNPEKAVSIVEEEPATQSSFAFDQSCHDMILLGIFGIQDPVRPEVPVAVATCQKAGIVVRMVTGDNAETARAIAKQCGILTEGGIVIEGPDFRLLDVNAMDALVPKLQVMARSSPLDKQILVQCLKRLGETVAVTGDGTNDAPALKSADVGFSMGIAGTEVAKEASDIVLLDDNFASLVKAVIWGRSVYDSVRKFLQFQLTVNVSAVIITVITSLISTIATPSHIPQSVLSAIQLLWVNLIMDTFAALALATDNPTDSLLERKPAKKSDPLINTDMWRQIIGQAIYQIIICFILYLKSEAIFGIKIIDPRTSIDKFAGTVVFNTFVLAQLFNELNCRSISRDLNVCRGVLKNRVFLFIIFISLGLQILIVEFGGDVFHTVSLDWKSWLICGAFGFGSVPVGFLIRLVPHLKTKEQEVLETVISEQDIKNEIGDLHRIVIDSVETSKGRILSVGEKSAWLNAIQRSSSQLQSMGRLSHSTRAAFREGVLIGAQMAMAASATPSIKSSSDDFAALEKSPSRGKELWTSAGSKVRHQVGVIDAFRRYRRDNTFIGKSSSNHSVRSFH